MKRLTVEVPAEVLARLDDRRGDSALSAFARRMIVRGLNRPDDSAALPGDGELETLAAAVVEAAARSVSERLAAGDVPGAARELAAVALVAPLASGRRDRVTAARVPARPRSRGPDGPRRGRRGAGRGPGQARYRRGLRGDREHERRR